MELVGVMSAEVNRARGVICGQCRVRCVCFMHSVSSYGAFDNEDPLPVIIFLKSPFTFCRNSVV